MKIEELVLNGAGQSFAGKDFQQLCGPGVYLFLEKGIPLYVGMGSNVLTRCSQTRHRKKYVRDMSDEIRIFPCVSKKSAKELESKLIGICKPRFNVNRGVFAKKLLGLINSGHLLESTRHYD